MKTKLRSLSCGLLAFAGASGLQAQSASYNLNTANGGTGISGAGCSAFGTDVLDFNSGLDNTGFGFQALYANTTGAMNSAIGYKALYSNTTGNNNTAAGESALYSQSGQGDNNTAAGVLSLYANIDGDDNTADGYGALQSNDIGSKNTASGMWAMGSNASLGGIPGEENTVVGGQAMFWSVDKSHNTAAGYIALNQGGVYNVCIGAVTNPGANSNSHNICFGSNALGGGGLGLQNVAFGYGSIISGAYAWNNTAFGHESQYYNFDRTENVTLGSGALYSLGYNNVGDGNVALGSSAHYNNLLGSANVAVGTGALYTTIDGDENVAVGYLALGTSNPGSLNTYVGHMADMNGTYGNASALGAFALGTSSDEVRIGDVNTSVISSAGFYISSDGRYKHEVEDKVPGRSFINELKPVTYNFEYKKAEAYLIRDMADSIQQIRLARPFKDPMAHLNTGFLAQEVEAAAAKTGYNFSGVLKPDNDHDIYSIAYSTFVMPLVQTIKEQQEMIAENNRLNEQLKAKVESYERTVSDQTAKTPALQPAAPEDFMLEANAGNGKLSLRLSAGTLKDVGSLHFYSLDGREIKALEIKNGADGSVELQANDLKPGIYYYTVVSGETTYPSKTIVINK